MGDIEFFIAVLAAAAVLVRLADYIAIPYPIVLVIGGVGIGFVPGLPDLEVDPHTIFVVFLPPLLHAAGFYAPPTELKTAARQLVSLSFTLVLLTMGAVAVVAHTVIDGLSWEAAFLLGAIVAPTDPVSAAATFSRLGVPDEVRQNVEGEAMLNDAAALVAYRVALSALVTGTFALDDAALDFVGSVAGGVGIGLAVGVVGRFIQQRLDDDVPLSIFLSVIMAYGAYIAAEEIHTSGVLATVTAGIYFGWHSHSMFDAERRLNAIAFWEVLVFGLNAMLFMILGLQLEEVKDTAEQTTSLGTLLGYVALISAVVIGLRMAWVMCSPYMGETWRERLVIGWSGMRGAISLAAVLAIPATLDSGAEFADRDLLIFVTAGVIVVTLVGQGLTLPMLIRAVGLQGERVWSPDEAIARLEAAQAALDRLDELEAAHDLPEDRVRRMREVYEMRFQRCMAVLRGTEEEEEEEARQPVRDYAALRRELIAAERGALLDLRDTGRLKGDVLRLIQRDLDLEEARLPS